MFLGRAFDSAKSRLKLPVEVVGIGKLSGSQLNQPVHMLIIQRFLVLVWKERIVEIHFPTLPTPTESTDASCTMRAVDRGPQVLAEHEIFLDLAKLALFAGIGDGIDGAYSNLKYENHILTDDASLLESGRERPDGSRLPVLCGNHTHRITESYSKEVLDHGISLKRLTNFISLLRTSNYFLRMISTFLITVTEKTIFRQGVRPDGSNEFARQLLNRLCSARGRYQAAIDGSKSRVGQTARANMYALSNEFLELVVVAADGSYLVYTESELTDAQKQSHCISIAKVAVRLLLQSIPGKPEAGKWTKDSPAIEWIVTLQSLVPLERLVDNSYRHIKVAVVGLEITAEMSFHEISGVRLKMARAMVASADDKFNLGVQYITMAASSYITEFFLICSRELHDPCVPAPALDFILPETSVVTVALQFLAMHDTMDCEELRALWVPLGYASWEDLVRNDEVKASRFRVTIYSQAAGLHTRFVADRRSGLNQLLRTSDRRVALPERIKNAEWLVAAARSGRHCCAGLFVHRFVLKFANVPRDLFNDDCQQAVRGLSWLVSKLKSVANCERRHLRTRRLITNDQNSMVVFGAKTYNEDYPLS